jgi:cobalt-zinc-cadmium efflux system outer membrane protein
LNRAETNSRAQSAKAIYGHAPTAIGLALALLPLCIACRSTPQPVLSAEPAPRAAESAERGARSGEQTPNKAPSTEPSPIQRVEYRAPPPPTPPNAGPRLSRPNASSNGAGGAMRGSIPSLSERLRIPPEVPGAGAAQLSLPPRDPDHPEMTYPIIDKLFPNIPPVWPLAIPTASRQRPPVSLDQLQQLAVDNNPELVQVRADITSMYGEAVQAGTHPNPTVGYEADTVGSSKTRNYQGVFFTQWIKTAGKLSLARAVKNYDVMNAQLALRRTRVAVLARIKSRYFAVLVAQENVVVTSALVRFTNEVYRIQTEKLKAGFAAAFEPAQLRSLADQARVLQVQAQNRYISAWKQLTAEMGLPQMPPSPLEGRADMPIPVVTYEGALNRVLALHPDVLIGQNMESQARVALRLAELTPVPDVYLYGTFQKDFTTPNYPNTSYNLQLGVPLPLWDRNKGGIVSARGDLVRASQQMRRSRNELTVQLADAFERYETGRIQLQYYRDHILPDLARAYRGVYERHQQEPEEVGFEGVIVAQQNLANAIATYITTLNSQWAAVADLANLMQVEDFDELTAAGSGALGTQADPGLPPNSGQPPANDLPAPARQEGRP